jgi:hypothetical protein
MIDTSSSVEALSMAIVNGRPAIAYLGDGQLHYARANTSTGSSWSAPIPLDGWFGGRDVCMEVVDGRPAIIYSCSIGGGGSAIRFIRAADSDGTSWRRPVEITSTATSFVDFVVTLADVNGRPAIAYHGTSDLTDLKFAFPE